jgi:hypothetical protein
VLDKEQSMKRTFLALTAFLCAAGVASAQTGLPPTFKIVGGADKDKGHILFTETVARAVPVQVVVPVVKNGVTVNEVRTEMRTVYTTVMVQHDAAKSRVITPDGKQLPIDEVWKRLKKDTVVVVSADGNTPAEGYLRALSADTLIVILPRVSPPQEPLPPPKKS